MSSPFAARRKARIIRQVEDASVSTSNVTASVDEDDGPVVFRPSLSSKAKKRSSSRFSFGPGGTSMSEDNPEVAEVFVPKKSSLSRKAIEKNALRKTGVTSVAADRLPIRSSADDRPSYDRSYIDELRSSTPTAPRRDPFASQENGVSNDPSSSTYAPSSAVDVASKFGSSAVLHASLEHSGSSAIPSEAEIREKKARRARLAKEGQYISLNSKRRSRSASSASSHASDSAEAYSHSSSNDSDQEDISRQDDLISARIAKHRSSRRGKPESRLIRDDEDLAEGFDDFVEADGKIALSRESKREERAKRKAAIRDAIAEAEENGGGRTASDDDGDERGDTDSDTERRRAYEVTQTKRAMEGLRHRQRDDDEKAEDEGASIPPKITPLPTFAGWFEKMGARLAKVECSLTQKRREMEEVERERQDIKVREEEIKGLLKEAGERFERLAREAGITVPVAKVSGPNGIAGVLEGGSNGSKESLPRTGTIGSLGLEPERGLEDFDVGIRPGLGSVTNGNGGEENIVVDQDEDEDEEEVFRPGLGA
ncbi:hypothetical protein MMC25_000153 [Agyrium rufum]|nr:hypothetical protein [Agyrium rufum]